MAIWHTPAAHALYVQQQRAIRAAIQQASGGAASWQTCYCCCCCCRLTAVPAWLSRCRASLAGSAALLAGLQPNKFSSAAAGGDAQRRHSKPCICPSCYKAGSLMLPCQGWGEEEGASGQLPTCKAGWAHCSRTSCPPARRQGLPPTGCFAICWVCQNR